MKRINLVNIIALICLMIISVKVDAQKKVYGIPAAFERPIDHFVVGPKNVEQYLYHNTGERSAKQAWVVISDRDNNPVYKSASVGSGEVKKLNFGDNMYYVIAQKDDWIQIADARIQKNLKCSELNPIGWIEKSKMLIWNSGLIDMKTRINKKAFLLKRADNIANVLKKKANYKDLIVDIYNDPNGTVKGRETTVYNYYFVMKKENGMYLLSEEAVLTQLNYKKKLIGWVSVRELEEWNTRLCLEPNFEKAAFDERKNSAALRTLAFGDPYDISNYYEKGVKDRNKIIWDSDPVLFDAKLMAPSDPKRAPKDVIRLPMFKKKKIGNIEYFKSGVIGSVNIIKDNGGGVKFISDVEIPELDFAQIKSKVADVEYRNDRLNVFFVVEGTDQTFAYQQMIRSAIGSLYRNPDVREVANVKYGALIYRDEAEGKRITEFQTLTSDIAKVTGFIEKPGMFSDSRDQDNYAAMYYGLKQGLKVAGFDRKAINIVVMIGSNGDFSRDTDRMNAAINSGSEAFIDRDGKQAICASLSDLNVHLFSLQLHNNGTRQSSTYARASQAFMLESAKFNYNRKWASPFIKSLLVHNKDLKLVPPSMENPIGKTSSKLRGSKPGGILLPLSNQSLSANQIEQGLNNMISESLNYERIVKDAIVDMYRSSELNVRKFTQDGSMPVNSFASGITDFLEATYEQSGVDSDLIIESTGTKLAVYKEVYLPAKLPTAHYPMFSHVLFMPESDLLKYHLLISKNLASLSGTGGSKSDMRKILFNIYMGLIKQFTGDDFMGEAKAEDLTKDDVLEIMQGVYGEGLELSSKMNIRIGDIRHEKKINDQEIESLIRRFNEVESELDFIIKRNRDYKFCMTSDNSNRYYWLRLDQVF